MTGQIVERHPKDGLPVVTLDTAETFEAWLEAHHADQPGVWVKLAKKGSGLASATHMQALEVALCYGWIDNKGQRYDDAYWLVRYQPRKPRSNWSERNKGLVERLIADGRMRPAGLAQVEAAKADGRWPS